MDVVIGGLTQLLKGTWPVLSTESPAFYKSYVISRHQDPYTSNSAAEAVTWTFASPTTTAKTITTTVPPVTEQRTNMDLVQTLEATHPLASQQDLHTTWTPRTQYGMHETTVSTHTANHADGVQKTNMDTNINHEYRQNEITEDPSKYDYAYNYRDNYDYYADYYDGDYYTDYTDKHTVPSVRVSTRPSISHTAAATISDILFPSTTTNTPPVQPSIPSRKHVRKYKKWNVFYRETTTQRTLLEPPGPWYSTTPESGYVPDPWNPSDVAVEYGGGRYLQPHNPWSVHSDVTPLLPSTTSIILGSSNETMNGVCESSLPAISNWTFIYAIALLIFVGALMNGIQLFVFRSRSAKKYPYGTYMMALAVVDTLSIFSHIPRKWIDVLYIVIGWGKGFTLYDTNNVICKLITFLSYTIRFLAAWLTMALCCERMSVSMSPYTYSRYRTVKASKRIIFYTCVTAVLLNSYVAYTWGSMPDPTTPGSYTCGPNLSSAQLSMGLTVFTLSLIVALPLVVLTVACVIMFHNISAWRGYPRKMRGQAIYRARLDRQATVMVGFVGAAYCCLSLPHVVCWTVLLLQHYLGNMTECQYRYTVAVRDITEVIFMLNHANKFLVCMVTGKKVLAKNDFIKHP